MKAKNRIWLCPLIVIGLLLILTNSCGEKDEESTEIKDADGNVYTSVTIGTQIWMKENLKTTKYNDGSAIPNVADAIPWGNLTTPAYCWYENEIASFKDTYGALYNWYTVNTGKLCPAGWHVPTKEEWSILVTFVGGENVAADKLKEAGQSHWECFGSNLGTNDYGFTALPGGVRYTDGSFGYIGCSGFWLTSSDLGAEYVSTIIMYSIAAEISTQSNDKVGGFSVRCLEDN
jgi:uncharacterized protein (TIGR02145 family)